MADSTDVLSAARAFAARVEKHGSYDCGAWQRELHALVDAVDALPPAKVAPPFENCPACGIPLIADAHALVLYFPSVDDCREAARLLRDAVPQTFQAYTTEGEVDDA